VHLQGDGDRRGHLGLLLPVVHAISIIASAGAGGRGSPFDSKTMEQLPHRSRGEGEGT